MHYFFEDLRVFDFINPDTCRQISQPLLTSVQLSVVFLGPIDISIKIIYYYLERLAKNLIYFLLFYLFVHFTELFFEFLHFPTSLNDFWDLFYRLIHEWVLFCNIFLATCYFIWQKLILKSYVLLYSISIFTSTSDKSINNPV